MEQCSITLIGMPAAGKSKIGKYLSEIMRFPFIDTDDLIVQQYRAANLQEVVDYLSPELGAFADVEESVDILTALSLRRPTIIATGGSMVYQEKAMRRLRERTYIIYLEASLSTIEERLDGKLEKRGVIMKPRQTIADLYQERVPLYRKCAGRTVNADTDDRKGLATDLAKTLRAEGIV